MNNPIAEHRPAVFAAASCLVTLLFVSNLTAAEVTSLRADSAALDGKTGEYLYRGNALLSQDNIRIQADEMQATQTAEGNLNTGRFRGNPAVLVHSDPVSNARSEARALEIFYDASNGRIELRGQAHLLQQDPQLNRRMQLDAEHIELIETHQQLSQLSASGQPVQFSRTEPDTQPLQGQAARLRYVGANEYLVLEGDAKLQQGPTQFEHVIIEYDGVRKLISAPKRDGQQVRITRIPDANGNATPPSSSDKNDKKEMP